MKYTDEQLKGMGAGSVRRVYLNCLNKPGLEASERIKAQIKRLGLLKNHSGGMADDDPVNLRIKEIIMSPEAKVLMVDATKRGLPALAGIETQLVKQLGDLYGPFDTGTSAAGYWAAQVMQRHGYLEIEKRPMPMGSVAKTAAFFAPK